MSDRHGVSALRRLAPLAVLGALLLLGGCATLPAPGPPLQPWAQRRTALLQAVERFTLDGRLAASNGREGFSAGLSWQQRGSSASVELTGPLGFGAARIEQNGTQLRITRANGVTLEGEAAQRQLAMMLGFEPPLRSLKYWVVGVCDPALSAEQALDARQRLVWLQQDGWRIDYDEYTPVRRQWLPRRLTVTRQDLRLKLVINGWQL